MSGAVILKGGTGPKLANVLARAKTPDKMSAKTDILGQRSTTDGYLSIVKVPVPAFMAVVREAPQRGEHKAGSDESGAGLFRSAQPVSTGAGGARMRRRERREMNRQSHVQ